MLKLVGKIGNFEIAQNNYFDIFHISSLDIILYA